jgi:membrane protease YdiL (CAAX protease family)
MGLDCVRPMEERRSPLSDVNMPGDPENFPPDAGDLPSEAPAPQPRPPLLPFAPREIWNPRDLLLFVAFIPFALLAAKFAVLIGYVVIKPFTGWHVKVDAVQSDTVFLLIQQCVFYVFLLAFLFLLAKLQHQQPFWKSLGWKKPTPRQVAGYLAGGGGLAVAVSLALLVRPDVQGFPLEQLFSSRIACYAIGGFAIGVAPVVEEVVFRGLLFAVLERAVGLRFAVVTTAALFAGLHVPEYWHAWNHMLMILVVGMVFSLARGMTGSLTPSIILHIGYNSLMMTGLFFSTQHFRTAGSLWMQ